MVKNETAQPEKPENPFSADMRVTLCGITLDNPVIPASGTFGYGAEFAEIYDINCLGTFSFKGTTEKARFGNDTPRIAECPGGLLNSVGLQNPGVEAVLKEELPRLKKVFHKPQRRGRGVPPALHRRQQHHGDAGAVGARGTEGDYSLC